MYKPDKAGHSAESWPKNKGSLHLIHTSRLYLCGVQRNNLDKTILQCPPGETFTTHGVLLLLFSRVVRKRASAVWKTHFHHCASWFQPNYLQEMSQYHPCMDHNCSYCYITLRVCITTSASVQSSNQGELVKIELERDLRLVVVGIENHLRCASSLYSLNLHICIESLLQTELKSLFVCSGLLKVPNGQRISM